MISSAAKQTPIVTTSEMTKASSQRNPLVLQQQDQQHVERGKTDAPDQRDSEQQVQRDGRADYLGQVARRDRDLAQHPQHEADRPRIVVAARLRQIASGGDAELERERLEQNRHQVRQQDDAEQGVAEARPAGQIGGPVARVHVADRHHVARAGERQRLAPERDPLGHIDRVVRLRQAR